MTMLLLLIFTHVAAFSFGAFVAFNTIKEDGIVIEDVKDSNISIKTK